MKNHTALLIFSCLTLFMQSGLTVLYFLGSPFVSAPLLSSIGLLAIVIGLYAAMAKLMPIRPRASSSSISARKLILLAQVTIMIVALITTLIYIPTTSLAELFKRVFFSDYVPQYTPIEIRLSSAYMPVWIQGLLEFARRISAPYSMIELVFGRMRREIPPLASILIWLLLAIFTLMTLERVIGVLYFASAILALFFAQGIKRTLTSRYTYICLASIALVIVVFKQVQYGEFEAITFKKNPEIFRELSIGITGADKQDIEIGESPYPALRYAHYFARSLAERIFLSPVTMIVYSSQNYNHSNFQHWKATRIFSLLGFGGYISPLQIVTDKHNEAFPVTYIGDLWRNGGPTYFPFYAILIGFLLYWLDRQIFSERDFVALKVSASFGILFLFYGNAFNATSWACILCALMLAYILPRLPEFRTNVT